MTTENKEDIALKELLNSLDYVYQVFSDNEYFQLSSEQEEELENTHKQISKSGYVLYYRKKEI
ncbi:hypothetical protein [Sulfurimonas sp.]|uniref:hypothetical protein n=1 Tax=Sulfurimonas sp. TaxID=2022749 RepID=UPI002AB1CDE0|nr:hypothetical protein [Sulfurimonas sp.]